MTPKSESFSLFNMIPTLQSMNGNDEYETSTNRGGNHFKNSPNRILDHSFSQSESDDISNSCNKVKNIKIKDLQSDFVHLHSIKVHSCRSIQHLHPHDESKEGFQFRSLRASMQKSSKIVVVVPSIDLDRKELRR